MNKIKKCFIYMGLIVSAPMYGLNYILEKIAGTPVFSFFIGFILTLQIFEGLLKSTDHIIMKIIGSIMLFTSAWIVTMLLSLAEGLIEAALLIITVPFKSLFLYLRCCLDKEEKKKYYQKKNGSCYNESNDEKTYQKDSNTNQNCNKSQDNFQRKYQNSFDDNIDRAWREAEKEERKRNQKRESTHRPTENDLLHQAMDLFGLKPGFTKAELRSRRRELAKRYHPDEGGDAEMIKKINNAFDRLQKIAKQNS